MSHSFRIICGNDRDVANTLLRGFPTVPARGDHVEIDGVLFEVMRMVFTTQQGQLPADSMAIELTRLDSRQTWSRSRPAN